MTFGQGVSTSASASASASGNTIAVILARSRPTCAIMMEVKRSRISYHDKKKYRIETYNANWTKSSS